MGIEKLETPWGFAMRRRPPFVNLLLCSKKYWPDVITFLKEISDRIDMSNDNNYNIRQHRHY